jgi:hypothetical protein
MPPLYGEGDKAFDRLKDQIAIAYRRHLEGIGPSSGERQRQRVKQFQPLCAMDLVNACVLNNLFLRAL